MELIFVQNSNKLLYLSYFIEQNYLIDGVSLYFYFLKQNISWKLELPVWIRLSDHQVPKIHPCCHQPFIQHWGYSLCVGFYMGTEGLIADAPDCTANTLPIEPTP